jgi:hypothetical protein
MKVLAATQIASFTTTQMRSLSSAQIQALDPKAIPGLTSAQLRALTTGQLAALLTKQLAALTAQQKGFLTSAQVAVLQTAGMKSFMLSPIVSALTGAGISPDLAAARLGHALSDYLVNTQAFSQGQAGLALESHVNKSMFKAAPSDSRSLLIAPSSTNNTAWTGVDPKGS